jgi:hypothetical protein
MKNLDRKRCSFALLLIGAILFILVLLFSSCETVPEELAISVESVFPENDSTDIALNVVITATLSDPIDESTLIEGTFTLSGPEGDVSGAISYNENDLTIIFTPDRDLYLFRTYTATISGQIQDSGGNSLEGEFGWSFMTRQGVWGQIEQISSEESEFSASLPQVAAESFSDSVAVWEDYEPDSLYSYFAYTNRFDEDTDTWSSDTFFNDGGFENFSNNITPQIAVDDNGKAVAVWSKEIFSEFTFKVIFSAIFSDSSWKTPEMISPDEFDINGGDATAPQIDLNPSGSGIAVWIQVDNSTGNNTIHANRLTDSTWGTPGSISNEDDFSVVTPQVALDESGNGISVWAEDISYAYYGIMSNRFTNNAWQTAKQVSLKNIEKGNSFDATSPQIALDPSGMGYSVYRDVLTSLGNNYRIFAAKFDGSGWEDPVAISPTNTVLGGSFDAWTPHVGADDNGNAFAVWLQNSSINPSIYANRNSSSGWNNLEEISQKGSVEEPRIAVNAFGDAIAIWLEGDGEVQLRTVVARRFDKTSGQWFDKENVSDGLSNALYPDIGISDDGTAIVVWVQDGNVFANRLE